MRRLIKKLTPKPLIYLYRGVRYIIVFLLFYYYRIHTIENKRIVFCNVWGFGDNPKYIANELKKRGLNYDIVFITNNPEQYKDSRGLRMLKTNTPSAVKALCTAHIWIDSNRKEGYVRKRRGQYYIQTWHGGIALKKIEGDCAKYLGKSYIRRAKRDSEITDLYISNSGFCTKMYRRAFWFQGEILECGSPRNDFLIHPDSARSNQIRKILKIQTSVKVALFAPTYREEKMTSAYEIDAPCLLDVLKKRFGGDWLLLIRLHPLVSAQSQRFQYEEDIIDASNYGDMYELLQVAEILITDYSNTMFEFAMTGKPVFLYASDLTNYQKKRGLYFDYKNLPFAIAETEIQLRNNILDYKQELHQIEIRNFFKEMELAESGFASKQVADFIIKIVENK